MTPPVGGEKVRRETRQNSAGGTPAGNSFAPSPSRLTSGGAILNLRSLGFRVQLGRSEATPCFWATGFVSSNTCFITFRLAATRSRFIAGKMHGILGPPLSGRTHVHCITEHFG